MLPNMTSMKRFTGKKDQLHIVIFFLFSLYLLIMARLHNWLAQEVPVHTPFSSGVQFSVSSSSQKQKPLREQSKEHAAIMPNATTERVSPRSKGPERDRTNDLDSSRPMNPFLSTTGNQIPFIYKKGNWDGAPIVVEEYKLVFFTQAKVACTVFKQLLRRMMHLEDWMVHKEPHLPHNPSKNGLKYLYNFAPSKAYSMMTAPDWTRAIFLRDPKERALSAYLDKAARKEGLYVYRHCCRNDVNQTCAKKASRSFTDFVEVIQTSCCCDPHWKPQSQRLDESFWKYVNFVGQFDALAEDTQRLLMPLNGWEFGADGWGPHGNESIFAEGSAAKHQTSAITKLQRHYNTSRVEKMVEEFYAKDYAHPLLHFERKRVIRNG